MATKVKGDAIKEGSIPLSALSNEVKDKIENAGGGADWNAKQGEAGYIENKPFRKIKSKYNEISNINSYFVITESAFYPTNNLFIKYNNKTVLLAKEKQEIYWGDGTTVQIHDATFFLADDGESNIIVAGECEFDFELIIALSSEFISISDAFLNQALANLGINPVVLKYLCNPYIACVEGIEEDIEEVPEDLRSIIIKDDALSDIVLNLVYFKDMSDSDEPIYKAIAKNYDKIICDSFVVTYNYSTNKFNKYYD